MGKRSNFERREAHFYATPRAAVAPLAPYLRGIRSFAGILGTVAPAETLQTKEEQHE
jgi:hypothetical protein